MMSYTACHMTNQRPGFSDILKWSCIMAGTLFMIYVLPSNISASLIAFVLFERVFFEIGIFIFFEI